MSQPVKIAVAGALGRMGQAVIQTLDGRNDAVVAARFDRPGAEGEHLVTADAALAVADAVIDFTLPEASALLAEAAAARAVVAHLREAGATRLVYLSPTAQDDPNSSERGAALRAHCDKRLREAEERVEKITLAANGQPNGTVPVEGL